MEDCRVVLLEKGVDPVSSEKIEGTIKEWAKAGWSLFQLSTGGGGSSDYYKTWVYLVFKPRM